MRSAFVIAAASIVLAACVPKAPPATVNDPTAVRTAIDATNKAFAASIMAGDAADVASYYTDDAIVMQPNDVAWKGRDAMTKGFTGFMAMGKMTQFDVTTDDVMVDGDMAVETGRIALTMTPAKGKAMQDKIKYITVWKKQADGSWKIVRDINNSDLPPAK